MSEIDIWNALRRKGITATGTAAIMGNLAMESALQSNNVENRCPMTDAAYTEAVDSGKMSKQQFMTDAYGYGLAQWTFYSRKALLWDKAKSRGVSIADEQMQIDLLFEELNASYPNLLAYLFDENGILYEATRRFCVEFERPAINNVTARFNKASEYLAKFSEVFPEDERAQYQTEAVQMPILKRGSKGVAVGMVQTALGIKNKLMKPSVDCDFGGMTEAAVMEFNLAHSISEPHIVSSATWVALYK